MTTCKTLVPFCGFYETSIGEYVDPHQPVFDVAQRWVDVVRGWIATRYADCSLELSCVTSPKYYNFETDKITAEIDTRTLSLLATTHRDALESMALDALTPRSGFVPFHSPCVCDWGPIADWTPALRELVLHAFLHDALGEDYLAIVEDEVIGYFTHPDFEEDNEPDFW